VIFLESIWTKVLQARGDMKTPMAAQICGAVTNIILDPLLIFGMFGFPKMGIAGAATATVAGQIVAALVVMKKGFCRSPELKKYPHYVSRIFRLGLPSILMQSAYTFYIFGLNLILATFSDAFMITFSEARPRPCRLDGLPKFSNVSISASCAAFCGFVVDALSRYIISPYSL
jgi:Na+-driven multidrug efflux pump